jgi:phosphoglycolate phosphatase
MSKPYRLVVFDWEGTLGDTLGQILNTVSTVAKQMQFGELDERLARQYVVLGLVMAVKKLFPHLAMHQHEQLLHEVHHALATHPTDMTLIPGAEVVVQRMQQAGIDLAIATNKGQASLQRALKSTGLDAFFGVTRSAGQVPAKPCPQMLEEIMDVFGATPAQTLMIGDSVMDIEMARDAGVDAIGVDFYHQQAEDLRAAGALEVFDDYEQLANYLLLSEE